MEKYKTLKNVCVIIPVYKAKEKISIVVKKLLKLNPLKIILVDDCCPDKSLKKLNIKNKKIIKIYHRINKGVGGAFISGVKFLNKKNYKKMKYIAKIDSDDQHDPTDLLNMNYCIVKYDADFIKGNRFLLMNKPKKMSIIRKIGNSGLTFLFKLASGQWHLSDPVNGIFLGQKKVIFDLLRHNIKDRYLLESNLLFLLTYLKAKIIEIPTTVVYGQEKSSLKWYKEIMPFFWFYTKGFGKRVCREYFYPELNPGALPLLTSFIFFLLSMHKLLNITENINKNILSEIGDINLFVIYFISFLISFFFWLLFDTSKNKNNEPIYHFYK